MIWSQIKSWFFLFSVFTVVLCVKVKYIKLYVYQLHLCHIVTVVSNPRNFTFFFYRRNKKLYIIYFCYFFVTILRILSKKLLMNTSFGYFWRQQSVHVKLELMMFWHEKRFPKLHVRGFVPFLYNSITLILLCNLFKSW